jgi:hypothetical protein
VVQVKSLNSGLAKYDAMLIVRMYQSMLAVFSILSGFFYFNEIKSQTPVTLLLFFVGFFTSVR